MENSQRRMQNNRRQLREESRTQKGTKMTDKDREIWIGENRLYFDEDNILYETVVGVVDEKIAIAFREASLKIGSKAEGRVIKVFVDLSRAGKSTPEARRIAQQSLEDERIGKVAFFGLHPVARVIASFVMGATRKKDMRFFRSNEKALAWLKE